MSSSKRTVIGIGATPNYSKAQVYNGVVYASGQVGNIPGVAPPKFPEGGFKPQTVQALKNLETALKEAGSDMSKVLKVTAMLDDIKDYNDFNEVYLTFFSDVNTRPARVRPIQLAKVLLLPASRMRSVTHENRS